MPDAVERKLFEFLVRNHRIHARIQREDMRNCVHARRTVPSRVYLLLYRTLMTQSQPRLSETKKFFEKVEREKPLSSMRRFMRFLGTEHICTGLAEQPGWGDKTAALFVRNLAVISRTTDLRELFWADLDLFKQQPIKLPVDAVIKEVFRVLATRLHADKALTDYASINRHLLNGGYTNCQMMIWDDLWFWGFITQRSAAAGGPRTHGWNSEKYWMILNAPKSDTQMATVAKKADTFLKLIGAKPVETGSSGR